MASSPKAQRHADAEGSDESPSDLHAPNGVPNITGKLVLATESRNSDEELPPANPETHAKTHLRPSVSPLPSSPQMDGRNAVSIASARVASLPLNGDGYLRANSSEQVLPSPHSEINVLVRESLGAEDPPTGTHEELLLDAHGEIQGTGKPGSPKPYQKQHVSRRGELLIKSSSSQAGVLQRQAATIDANGSVGGSLQQMPLASDESAPKPGSSQCLKPGPLQAQLQPITTSSRSTLTDASEPSLSHSVGSSQATTPVDPGDSLLAAEHVTSDVPGPLSLANAPQNQPAPRPFEPNDLRSNVYNVSRPSSLPTSPRSLPRPRRMAYKVRPKASIPLDLTLQEYAGQCIAAAESSRLNPYALHEEEHALLREHISHAQVTTYLNIRNGILRLWLGKPHIAITKNEAIGCAKESRWFDIASVCFDWLVRRGYINYGCVEFKELHNDTSSPRLPMDSGDTARSTSPKRRKRIAVIGAGMAGLGCARQLHSLFQQYGDLFREIGEEVPEVVVFEGRNRIGGRVYSRAFEIQPRYHHPDFPQSRCTAEMGGMIVTGFDRGNPMNTLIRGQLGLGYHALLSTTTIYDINGLPVDSVRDGMVENLFNECLDRVSEYKFKLPVSRNTEGSRQHIDEGRDISSEGHQTIASVEQAAESRLVTVAATDATAKTDPNAPAESPTAPDASHRCHRSPETETSPQVDLVPVSSDRLTGRANLEPGTHATLKAAHKLKIMGWDLKPGVTESQDLDLDPASNTPGATFGFVVEEAVRQYGELIDLNAQDFRLLNWHIANLEYSNAINQNCLSLWGWDIDAGNEWEGKHSMVIGGYQSVPRGLMLCPTPLDVRRQVAVRKITYESTGDNINTERAEAGRAPVVVECENGEIFEADYAVNTIPLGVLKHGNVEFNPPLPAWKADAIKRLGYGVLNKVILTYRRPFWDTARDIFGVLREPANRFSLDQKEYSQRRGRMFQWFNASKTTGIPCLVALMAGDAAFDTEKTGNDELVAEATSVLRSIFGPRAVPDPIEAIVTRWASDKFARGSYSSAGPSMKMDDYDTMARPVGRHLFFAGEHTIGTHPATVHGAYLSGLRAASEVFEELVGPIQVPTPLVLPKDSMASAAKRKFFADDEESRGGDESSGSTMSANGSKGGYRDANPKSRRRLEARESHIQERIRSQIGDRPEWPHRPSDSAYLLFSKANYERARKKCEEGRRPGKGRPLPNEVRVLTSKMWRSAGAEERRPFAEKAAAQKLKYDAAVREFNERAAEWDQRAAEIRTAYEEEYPDNGERVSCGTPTRPSTSASASAAATPDKPASVRSRRLRRTASHQTDYDTDGDVVA